MNYQDLLAADTLDAKVEIAEKILAEIGEPADADRLECFDDISEESGNVEFIQNGIEAAARQDDMFNLRKRIRLLVDSILGLNAAPPPPPITERFTLTAYFYNRDGSISETGVTEGVDTRRGFKRSLRFETAHHVDVTVTATGEHVETFYPKSPR